MEYGYDIRSYKAADRAADIAQQLTEREIRFEIRPFAKTGFTVFVDSENRDELDRVMGHGKD